MLQSINSVFSLLLILLEQILGDDENSLTDLITWCENNKTIPINDDKVFCGAFDYVVDKYDKIKSININLYLVPQNGI